MAANVQAQPNRRRGRRDMANGRPTQDAIDRLADQQQDTARILERVMARLEGLEHWRDTQERALERAEDRRDDRDDKRPDLLRANTAIAFSAVTAAIYVLTFLAQHWRP